METKNILLPNQLHRKLLALLVIFLLVLNLKGFSQAPPPIPGGGKMFTIKVYLEGLYNLGTSSMNKAQDFETDIVDRFNGTIVDKITVELHDPANYATPAVYPYKQEFLSLLSDGTVQVNLPSTGSYYLTIKTRNHLETVSANPINLTNTSTYDFTTAASQAYGDNQKMLASGVYGIYAGDTNQDGLININDAGPTNTGINDGNQGYLIVDIDGNAIVNINDAGPVNTNINNGIEVIVPQ